MRRVLAIAALFILGAFHVGADDSKPSAAPGARPAGKSSTPEEAADVVLATVKAKDVAALKVLAAKDDPDPWLVADELCARRELDAALAFAKASIRKDTERLPDYVASRLQGTDDAAARKSLSVASAALGAGNFEGALAALGPPDLAKPANVVGIRRAFGRGIALRALHRLEPSATAFLVAADAAERSGWLVEAARAVAESGQSAYLRSDYRGALSAWERWHEVAASRGDLPSVAGALGNIGLVHDSLGNRAKAVEYQERALKMMEELGDRAGAARALGNLGNIHASLGNYRQSLELHERALRTKEELGNRAGAATTVGNIGTVYSSLGDYPKALEYHERALRSMEETGDRAGVARTLGQIGHVHASLGNFPRALEYGERSLKMREQLGDRAGVARTLGRLGNVHDSLGNFAKALEYDERALKMSEGLGDRAGVAATLGSIGIVHRGLGNYPKALEYLERALELNEELGDSGSVATTLGNLGNLYVSIRDYPKALEVMERALKMREASGVRMGVATTLGNLGNVHFSLGDHPKALEYYERALQMKEELGDRAGVAGTLSNIGVVYASLGKYPKALEYLERATRAAEKLRANALLAKVRADTARTRLRSGDARRAIEDAHRAVSLLEKIVGGLGEEQGATARERYASLFSVGLLAAARAEDAAEAAFFLESGRAGTLLETLGSRDALRWAGLPEDLRRAEAAARGGEARALVAYTKALDVGERDAIRARDEELTAARARVQEVVERIQRDAKNEARLLYPVASPVEEIQGFLTPGDALVLYGLAQNDDAHALVLTRKSARLVNLGKSREIETACEGLVLSDPGRESARAIHRLRDLLIVPLSLATGTNRLLVSPQGPLSYVPFSALAPELEVACEPSGTTYGVLLEERTKRGEQVLALADPDYGAKFDPTSLDLYLPTRGGRLVPLPGTREEAKAVGDVTLLGKDASEAGLRAALARKKARWHGVHFACHGIVDPERPSLSCLVLTPDAGNDGFLTALEVLRMEIPSDLVVLSACETGKGKIFNGEGIVGLTRAFMHAGAPRVLCSLWKVDDDATRALMTKFYALWNPKDGSMPLGTAAALRAAQAHVRAQERWSHPYYWAAWVLWGLAD